MKHDGVGVAGPATRDLASPRQPGDGGRIRGLALKNDLEVLKALYGEERYRSTLAALPPAKAGQASGVVSACTFLGGSAGIAAGGLAEKLAGLDGVLAMIALAAVLGILLARMLSSAAPSPAA